jgi:hypothetical protein
MATRYNWLQRLFHSFKNLNKGDYFTVEKQEEQYVKDDISLGTDSILLNYVCKRDGVLRRISIRGEKRIIYFTDTDKAINGCTFKIDEKKQTILVNFSNEIKTKGGTVEFDVVFDGVWKTDSRHKEDGYRKIHVVLTLK